MKYYVSFIALALMNCAGQLDQHSIILPKDNYNDLVYKYKSCSGNGNINSVGPINGSLAFSFRSQRDSTFFQFTDPIGRKALLMWITPNNVTARNLIDNKQYSYDQIIDFFPFLKVMNPNKITEFLWGVVPEYEQKDNVRYPSNSKNITLEFLSQPIGDEPHALAIAEFQDNESNQTVRVNIKNRKRNMSQTNLKKVWKLLEY
jgi:hypothetical protein|tara:strand:- start:7334 stop:7942 length:609 start_codon:yes stop_codon:yes gene_type:complete